MIKKVKNLFLVSAVVFLSSCVSVSSGKVYVHPVEVQTAEPGQLEISYKQITNGPDRPGSFMRPYGSEVYGEMDLYGNFVPDALKRNVRGPVKKIVKKYYPSINEGSAASRGELDLRYSNLYKYDRAGNLYEIISPSDADDFSSGSSDVFEHYYDSLGRCVSYDSGEIGGSEYRYVFKYDDMNRVIKRTVFRKLELYKDSKPLVFSYDSVTGLIAGDKRYTYDYESIENGGLMMIISEDNKISDIYTFDKNGTVVEESESFSDTIILNRSSAGFKTAGFKGVRTRVNFPDEFGNIRQVQESTQGGKIVMKQKEKAEYAYEYSDFDENDNWLTKTSYKNGDISYWIEREITYY